VGSYSCSGVDTLPPVFWLLLLTQGWLALMPIQRALELQRQISTILLEYDALPCAWISKLHQPGEAWSKSSSLIPPEQFNGFRLSVASTRFQRAAPKDSSS
jgi:hypothetical protein